jgi:hypothetical protein
MAQYKTCEYCGSNLDHGEKCDCNGIPQPKPAASKRAVPVPAAKEKKRKKTKVHNRRPIYPIKYRP